MKSIILYLIPIWYTVHPASTSTVLSNSHETSKPAHAVTTTRNYYRIGDRLLTIVKQTAGMDNPYLLISLHNNERTAISVASRFVREHNAAFFELVNDGNHNIEANLINRKIAFDPNMIFTTTGRKVNLKSNHCWNNFNSVQAQLFARYLLEEFMEAKTIVALHNADGNFTIKDYKNGSMAKLTKEIYISTSANESDFILTTVDRIFEQLKAQNFNVVLLTNHKVRDNGSLGYYCAKANKPFVSIETAFDHKEEQLKMLTAIDTLLQ